MKKSLIAVLVIIFIAAVSGIVYITGSSNKKIGAQNQLKLGLEEGGQGKSAGAKTINDISFGEFKCSISDNDTITIKYIKSGQTNKIFSLNPVADADSYDISPNGNSALYQSKDGHIWIIYSNGTSKKITPDKYNDLNKNEVQKSNPGYVWADKPSFMPDGNVEFISDLPERSSSSKKTIWKINMQDGKMYPIYKPSNENFKLLGYRSDDGKCIILDGAKIVAIDDSGSSSGTYESIDVKDKHIINLSPDGKRLIFAYMDGSNSRDFTYLYVMDAHGKNIVKVPGVEAYKFTQMSAWNDEGTECAFITKTLTGNNDKIAVLYFTESAILINSFDTNTRFADNSKVYWSGNNAISVDTGNDVVAVSLNQ